MEITTLSLKNRVPRLSRGQWLAVGLIGLLLMAVIFSLIMYLRQPPVVVGGDFEPFNSQQEYQAFNKAHPAMYKKVPDSAHFHFKTSVSPSKQLVVQIYLLQVALKPTTNMTGYAATLKTFQQEAKDWFKKQGEDLSKDYVQWFPNPAGFEPTPTPTAHPPIASGSGSAP